VSIFARDFKIVPASSSWTEFYIRAQRGYSDHGTQEWHPHNWRATPSTIKEGQQITRNDAADCGIAEQRSGAVPQPKRQF
jgi:hypothetical protein